MSPAAMNSTNLTNRNGIAGSGLVPQKGYVMSKSEDLRDQAVRARALSQTVSDAQSSKALTEVVQKYEDDANQLELSDRPADDAVHKTHPPEGWLPTALSELDTGDTKPLTPGP